MIVEIGGAIFRIGLAVVLVSTFVVGLAEATGMPVPSELVASSGLIGLVSGMNIKSVFRLVGSAIAGLGILTVISYITPFLSGRQVSFDISRYHALAVYLSLFTVASDGFSMLLELFLRFLSFLAPPLSASLPQLVIVTQSLAMILLGYYLIVRVFSVPAE